MRRLARARGAVFVEALIVVAFMVTVFTLLIWLKTYFVTRIQSMRWSRTGTLEYAMCGCQNGNPEDAILGMVRATGGGAQSSGVDQNLDQIRTNQDQTAAEQDAVNHVGSDMNHEFALSITSLTISGEAALLSKGYDAKFTTQSWVGCARGPVTYKQNVSTLFHAAGNYLFR